MVFTTADGVVSMEEIQEHQLAEHKTEPNSGLGKAISYLLNHWLKLTLDNRPAATEGRGPHGRRARGERQDPNGSVQPVLLEA